MKKAAFHVARLMHYAFSYRATKPVSFDGTECSTERSSGAMARCRGRALHLRHFPCIFPDAAPVSRVFIGKTLACLERLELDSLTKQDESRRKNLAFPRAGVDLG